VNAPSDAALLVAWERGRSQAPVERGLTLLAAACPGTPVDELARCPVGRRDGELLALRRRLFGSRLTALSDCSACQACLEFAFDVEDVEADGAVAQAGGFERQVDGYELRFRLPDSLDLLHALSEDEVEASRRVLLDRCLLAARLGEKDHGAADLPAAVTDQLVEAMAAVDPQADVRLALACPDCGEHWQASFDVVAFLWSELAAWAERIVRDVHALASAYGWSEADLLAMHPERRRLYLELVGT
jgi:hypothetical protein